MLLFICLYIRMDYRIPTPARINENHNNCFGCTFLPETRSFYVILISRSSQNSKPGNYLSSELFKELLQLGLFTLDPLDWFREKPPNSAKIVKLLGVIYSLDRLDSALTEFARLPSKRLYFVRFSITHLTQPNAHSIFIIYVHMVRAYEYTMTKKTIGTEKKK